LVGLRLIVSRVSSSKSAVPFAWRTSWHVPAHALSKSAIPTAHTLRTIGSDQGADRALKVNTSNYRIEGFTKQVGARELAELTRERNVRLVNDLGSGTLVDLWRWGVAHEPTIAEAIANVADIVTFSSDKLLGGSQAGFIDGRRDLITKINRNPIKRALRVDKIRFAALEATLRLYRSPERLAESLPTIRLLARPQSAIKSSAQRLLPIMAPKLANDSVEVVACASQIGSGALPPETIPSAGLAIRSRSARGAGPRLNVWLSRFDVFPTPVIGRVEARRTHPRSALP
jgi:L-seryl-tRNA(Ser) seleniumtransferase